MIEWKFTTMKTTGQPGTSRSGAKAGRVETDFAKSWGHNSKFSGCIDIVHRTVLAKARLIQRHNFYRWAEMEQLQPNIGDYVPQDRQCTYNVTLRRFCATIVAVDKQKGLHILSARLHSCLSYAACKLHLSAPRETVVCGAVWLYNSFSHYFINCTIF